MDEGWAEAQESLTDAFRLCHASSRKNKRAILSYLIPVRMLLGVMPREEMLRVYNLTHFSPIVRAVRTGDPVALRMALEANQYRFIQVRRSDVALYFWRSCCFDIFLRSCPQLCARETQLRCAWPLSKINYFLEGIQLADSVASRCVVRSGSLLADRARCTHR